MFKGHIGMDSQDLIQRKRTLFRGQIQTKNSRPIIHLNRLSLTSSCWILEVWSRRTAALGICWSGSSWSCLSITCWGGTSCHKTVSEPWWDLILGFWNCWTDNFLCNRAVHCVQCYNYVHRDLSGASIHNTARYITLSEIVVNIQQSSSKGIFSDHT